MPRGKVGFSLFYSINLWVYACRGKCQPGVVARPAAILDVRTQVRLRLRRDVRLARTAFSQFGVKEQEQEQKQKIKFKPLRGDAILDVGGSPVLSGHN